MLCKQFPAGAEIMQAGLFVTGTIGLLPLSLAWAVVRAKLVGILCC